jgi:Ca-activated chloride channel family protein
MSVTARVFGAGLLTSTDPSGSLALVDHTVDVVIDGGYAKVKWTQSFWNRSDHALEAVYEVPLAEDATLAGIEAMVGDRQLVGEVLPKAEAETIYENEKAAGNNAGLATQESYKRYRYALSRIPADSYAEIEVTYYQPIKVDTGVGTFRYVLEEGGVDDGSSLFWNRRDTLEGAFSVSVEVRAGAPLNSLRAPGFSQAAIEIVDSETQRFHWSGKVGQLKQDFVLYYMLEENLPGRVEVFTHKPSQSEDGTFMAVVTPGIDLAPLNGQDYVFVLDLSGSMDGKMESMLAGVSEALKTFSARDRFRIVLFNDKAEEWTRGWVTATSANVSNAITWLRKLKSGGGTNLYDGLRLGLRALDGDRACSYILVTDAVANTGVVNSMKFKELLSKYDVRFFGFLLGNSSNQPLMKTLCEATGGYSRPVSNSQDIVGEILLAQSKVAYQSLYDAEFSLSGSAQPYDLAGIRLGKIFRGQQIVLYGRYRDGGELDLRLDARLTGQDLSYSTSIELPEVEPSRPELERLWAIRQLEDWKGAPVSALEAKEVKQACLDMALSYQLVTEDTAMLLLEKERFQSYGIAMRNEERSQRESFAPASSSARTDAARPLTGGNSASIGGGAFDLWWGLVVVLMFGVSKIYLRKEGSFE